MGGAEEAEGGAWLARQGEGGEGDEEAARGAGGASRPLISAPSTSLRSFISCPLSSRPSSHSSCPPAPVGPDPWSLSLLSPPALRPLLLLLPLTAGALTVALAGTVALPSPPSPPPAIQLLPRLKLFDSSGEGPLLPLLPLASASSAAATAAAKAAELLLLLRGRGTVWPVAELLSAPTVARRDPCLAEDERAEEEEEAEARIRAEA